MITVSIYPPSGTPTRCRRGGRVDFQIFYDTAKLYGYRWTLEILTALRERPLRFTDLIQTITPTPLRKPSARHWSACRNAA